MLSITKLMKSKPFFFSQNQKQFSGCIIENHFLIYLDDADVSGVTPPISPKHQMPVLLKIQKLVIHFFNRAYSGKSENLFGRG